MLHKKQVARAIYYTQRRRLKHLLGIQDRPHSPVLSSEAGGAFDRHLRICRLLAGHLERKPPGKGRRACEIGSGDCLASADLMLGAGFEKVYLVEKQPILVDQRQREVLARLAELPELPNQMQSIEGSETPSINKDRIGVIPAFFEEASVPEKVDFIFSFDVLEHVEDLDGFFRKCAGILEPDGVMFHKFDLSGHEFFEDPMPPLDFQIYPEWLYGLMFPKYRRACRHFLDEIVEAMKKAGFEEPRLEYLRSADPDYTKKLKKSLRKEAVGRTVEQLVPLDVVIESRLLKP